ncbi:hypothetical protein TI05_14760, partial [Achromatium sp. WMS3]
MQESPESKITKALQDMVSYVHDFTNQSVAAINAHLKKSDTASQQQVLNDVTTQLSRIDKKLDNLGTRLTNLEQQLHKAPPVSSTSIEQPRSATRPVQQQPARTSYQHPQAASHPTVLHSASVEPDNFNQRNTSIELILNFIFNRKFGYALSGLAFIGFLYFIVPPILGYLTPILGILPSNSQGSGATTKICKLATTKSQLTNLINKINTGDKLNSSQKDTNGTTAATTLLKQLANNPKLGTDDCDTLVNLLFAYRVAIWCKDKINNCTSQQKTTTDAIKVTSIPNNKINNIKVSELVGCADKTKVPTKDCRIKVIQGLFPKVESGTKTEDEKSVSVSTSQATNADICPDSQTKLKAPEQRERVKIWIAAAAEAKGLKDTNHKVSSGQKPIINLISQRLIQNQDLDARSWLTTIQDLFEYNLALKCKAIPAICGNINIIIDSAPEREVTAPMFQHFNQKLPPTCRV